VRDSGGATSGTLVRFTHPPVCIKPIDLGLIAVIDNGAKLRFVDPDRGRVLGGYRLAPEGGETLQADIAPKGHLCLVTEVSGTYARVLNVKTKRFMFRVGNHRGNVSRVAVDPLNRFALTAGDDGKVAAWDLTDGKRRFNLAAHTDRVSALSISDDGSRIASGGYDRLILLSRTDLPGESLKLRSHSAPVTALCFLGETRLVSADRDGGIALWELPEGKLFKRLERLHDTVTALACDHQTGLLFAATRGGKVALYDLEEGATVDTRFLQVPGGISAFAYLHTRQSLAVASTEGRFSLHPLFPETPLLERALEAVDYDGIEKAAQRNPAVRYASAYRQMQAAWSSVTEAIETMLSEDRIDGAEALLAPFLGMRSKKREIEGLRRELETYMLFREHVAQDRYAIAYDLALKYPAFKASGPYREMEQVWLKTLKRARKLLRDRRTEAEGNELLARFRGISEKSAAIRAVSDEGKRHIFLGELVDRGDWKKATEVLRHNPELQKSKAYKKLNDTADKLYISAQKAYSAGDYRTVRSHCERLLDVGDFKEDAIRMLERIKGAL
jgi:hypothetical protein